MGNAVIRQAAEIMFPFYVLISFGGMIWYYARRKLHPIPQRVPFFPLATQVLMCLGVVLIGVWMIIDFNIPCLVYEFWFFANFMSVTATFMSRVVHLLFRYHITQIQKSINSTDSVTGPKGRVETFVWEHRHWATPKYLRKIMFFNASGFIPVCVIFWLVNRDITFATRTNDPLCPLFTTAFTTILIGSGPLLIGPLAFLLKNAEEELHIREELFVACFLCVPIVVLTITPLNTSHYHEMMILWQIFFWGVGIVQFFPIYLTYRYARPMESETKLANRKLREVLQTPKGFDQFRDHLAKEFAVENLFFWRDLHEIMDAVAPEIEPPSPLTNSQSRTKASPSTERLSDFAALELQSLTISIDNSSPSPASATTSISTPKHKESKQMIPPVQFRDMLTKLHKEYVHYGAPNSINISYRLRLDLSDAIESLLTSMDTSITANETWTIEKLPKVFEETEKEILDMMESDSFIRFKQQDSQKSLVSETPSPRYHKSSS